MGADPSRTQIDIGEMMIGSGEPSAKPVHNIKDDKVGKSLHANLQGISKMLKGTRFNMNDPTVELPSEIMENWIDKCLETDKDVIEENERHKLSKNDKRTACKKWSITKPDLQKAGMSPEMIKRIHRGLFVHSMGFFELVQTACKPCKGSSKKTLDIWTVFSKLLEKC
jgi:hypothetical protein